jgi:FkbM family methyltransferase
MAASASTRARIRQLAAAAGLEEHARRLYGAVDPTSRRGQHDERHLRAILAACLARDTNCIDIGAHQGDVLAELCRYAPDGRHIAYEPLPQMAARLRERFPQVDVRNAGVSDRTGTSSFNVVAEEPEQSSLIDSAATPVPAGETITVDLHKLDESLPDGYVPGFIKIDVEGAEARVFAGAMQTLRRYKPIVVFEHGIGGADRFGSGPGEVYDLVAGEAGMRIYDLDGTPYDRAAFVAVFDQRIWNFIARP